MAYLECNGGNSSGYDEVVLVGSFNLGRMVHYRPSISGLVDDVSVVTASDFIVSTEVVTIEVTSSSGVPLPWSLRYDNTTGAVDMVYSSHFGSARGNLYLKIHH